MTRQKHLRDSSRSAQSPMTYGDCCDSTRLDALKPWAETCTVSTPPVERSGQTRRSRGGSFTIAL
jgi:hypothetical protein